MQRQIDYAAVNLAVACMEDIRRVDICPVLAAELVERNGRVVLPALDFNRKYILSAANLGLRNEKINLHPFFGVALVVAGEETKLRRDIQRLKMI